MPDERIGRRTGWEKTALVISRSPVFDDYSAEEEDENGEHLGDVDPSPLAPGYICCWGAKASWKLDSYPLGASIAGLCANP